VLALLAPGQGAQTPGQLTPWLDLDGVEARLRWWSAAAGLDLVDAGCHADAETIRDTAVAQPLIVANGLVAAEALGLATIDNPDADAGIVVAGHSVGEITAAAVAGALDPESAMVFVAARGRAMAAASALVPTGMAAVLGGDPEEVTAHLAGLGLVAANRNGAGQIVAAGTLAALDELTGNPPPGAKVRRLPVAGAFHTPFMEPARESLRALAAGMRPTAARRPLLTNAAGAASPGGRPLVDALVSQVAAPVRWDLCLAALRERGVTAILELPPAGTLAAIAKRELRDVRIQKIKTPDDLPAARELIAEHAAAAPDVTNQRGPTMAGTTR
jgi:[acyl-carrier-protein] S-malonyltransferase